MTSKYDPLGDHLAAIGAATVVLSFAEVEAIVGPLPKSARIDPSWWGVGRRMIYQYPHALHWRRMGYGPARPDFAAGTVTFRRTGPSIAENPSN